ncbi:MAG: sensor domain-containing diguanylate cyclase [Candidatus Atribacteria bacterium]|nr:sensor domain-containing diguanylate cyclase [Candidatus Atribacteria bacterium]
MKSKEKTKEQLMNELVKLRQQITELQKSEIKHQQIEETLQKSHQEFSSLFEGSPQAAIYHDKKGVIININPRFTELFGYTLEEVKGKNINQGMIFPQDKTREESERLTKSALEGEVVECETIREKKNGTLVPVIISVSPVIIEGQNKGVIAFYQDIAKQKSILEKLKESEEKYRNLFENMPGAYYRTDKDGNLVMINPEGAKLFGYNSPEDILGKNISQHLYFNPEERKKYLKELKKNKGDLKDFELTLKKKDGSPLVISDTSHYYYDKEGNIAGVEGIFTDITERKKSEETLQKSQQELASVFKNIPQAVVYLDENSNIKNISPRFTELFGYTLEEIKGKNINEGIIHPPGKIEEGKNLDKIASSEGYFNYESIRKKKDGTLFPVSISGSNIIIDGQLKGIIGTYFDITERKKLEKKLEKLAHFDNLTSCYSRGYGLALLEEQIKTANRKKTPILLLYLDVDEFKEINDTYSHKEGDRVLKEVVQFFKSTLRKVDIICRIGGDEFMLIFLESSLNNAPLIRERLSKNLEKLNQSLNKPYKISFSIGLSVYDPFNPLSIEELIKIADENMYEEKKKKKEGFFKTNVEEL